MGDNVRFRYEKKDGRGEGRNERYSVFQYVARQLRTGNSIDYGKGQKYLNEIRDFSKPIREPR